MIDGRPRSLQRQLLAWWLLLLLGRVLTPEAAWLRLHAHVHTVEEPTLTTPSGRPAKALFTSRHQHCHEAQLYQLPFLLALPVALPSPNRRPTYAPGRPGELVSRPVHLLDGACLRGPPAVG